MGKSSAAANVIDLETFRQKKMQGARESDAPSRTTQHAAMFVPVWYCWVPFWAPVFP